MFNARSLRTLFAALAFVASLPLQAGTNRWTMHGPETGTVAVIAADPKNPSVVYFGGLGTGVYKSWDGGTTWYAIRTGMQGTSTTVSALLVDPNDSNVVYAGCNDGLYRSADAGAHWSKIDGNSSQTVAVDPANSSIVYTATSNRVARSTDGGAHWTVITNGLPGSLLDLVLDPTNGSVVYIAAADAATGGVYKSTNAGASWTPVITGLTSRRVYSLSIDKHAPQTLYAGTGSGGGVFRTTNGGASWTQVAGGASGLPLDANYQSLSVSPADGAVYVGSNTGAWRSGNGGSTWTRMNVASDDSYFLCVYADPSLGSVVYAGGDLGFYKSTSSGTLWTRSNKGFSAMWAEAVVADPLKPGTAYTSGSEGLFKTTDGGDSWSRVGTELNVNALAVDPKDSRFLYASAGPNVIRSLNGGATWSEYTDVGLGSADRFYVDPGNSSVLWAVDGGAGIFTSTSNSAWVPRNGGLTDLSVRTLAFDPKTPATVYVTTNSALFRSLNGGASWSPVSGLPSNGWRSAAVDPQNPQIVYAASEETLYKSTNGGSSWSALTLPDAAGSLTAIVIDPVKSANVYLATQTGVFRSPDSGATWTEMDAGLANRSIDQLSIDGNGTRLYAGSYRQGTWAILLSPVVVAAAASVHGAGSTFFHSDVSVTNPSESNAVTVKATYRCTSGACGNAVQQFTIPPRETRDFDDIVATLFAAPETQGAIEFEAPSHIVVTSRLYTPSRPAPTIGQFIPGVGSDRAFAASVIPSLSYSTDSTKGFRTNLGYYNPNDTTETVTISLYSTGGVLLGQGTETIGPRQARQISNIFSYLKVTTSVPQGYATVVTSSGRGLYAYASVLDNQSQDPIFVAADDLSIGTPGTITVPAIASVHGSGNSFFHSDLAVTNVSASATANVTAVYRCITGNCGFGTRVFSLAPREERVFEDIAVSLFAAPETSGAVQFTTPGSITVTSRLYTPSRPAATTGQFIPGVAATRGAGKVLLSSLAYSPSSATGFRTNVGAFNLADFPVTLKFSLYNSAAVKVGEVTREVGARGAVQVNDVFKQAGVAVALNHAYCVIEGFGSVPLIGYASVLDNQSQDPICVVGEADTGN